MTLAKGFEAFHQLRMKFLIGGYYLPAKNSIRIPGKIACPSTRFGYEQHPGSHIPRT
jgi:hypothetical protein